MAKRRKTLGLNGYLAARKGPEPKKAIRQVRPADLEVAARVKLAREQAGFTQMEVGLALGVAYQAVHKYETGQSRITVSTLIEIGKAIGRDPRWLLMGD